MEILITKMTTNVLTIRFSNELKPYEAPLFRGAIINSLDEKLLLFHNHEGDKLRYAYPLIQYKRIGGKAAIVCLKTGTEEIGEFFSSGNFTMRLGERNTELQIASIKPTRYNIQTWDHEFSYRLNHWIPFNSENYQRYQHLEGIAERITFLENILTGNILSFTKGLGIWLEGHVACKITNISDQFLVTVKDVKVACFNAEFMSNVSLPNYIGLGRHVSIGHGIITHIYDNNNE